MSRRSLMLVGLAWLMTACTLGRSDPQVVYVTVTPSGQGDDMGSIASSPVPRVDLSPVPEILAFIPTSDPGRTNQVVPGTQTHVVVAGDTLSGIAMSYGLSVEALLATNEIENPDSLYVGQVINLPELPTQITSDFKIVPDSKLVRGPGSSTFDVTTFVANQPGYIRVASDIVETRQADGSVVEERLGASEIIARVALEFSIEPRILLILLEQRAGWLSNPNPAFELREFPLISMEDSGEIDRKGLYRQLSWAADRLNYGYYGWKYGNDLQIIGLADGQRLLIASGLNAGTVAIQYFMSLNSTLNRWLLDVSKAGFFTTYWRFFGDPFQMAVDPLVPVGIVQPEMSLPFAAGEVWYFTGGWHGGWGNGSAWAALDFAPPDDPAGTGGTACYTSNYSVRAVAPGVIARSNNGVVVLDLDGDMDEATGWTVLYLHIATANRVAAGTRVEAGDMIGRASCEGGFSTATHLHIARRYNGEWIPADCQYCPLSSQAPSFRMGQWVAIGLDQQVYQGLLYSDTGEQRMAEQGRENPNNQISW